MVRTSVVVSDHVIIPTNNTENNENANADAILASYVSDLTTVPLDTSKPLWEIHLLDLKTSDAENVVVLKFHHSLGDGMSLMALVLTCTRKTSNPDELPSLPYMNRSSLGSSRLTTGSRGDSRLLWLIMVIWSAIILVLNTVYDGLEFIATTMFLKDTETPIKGHFRLSKSKRMCLAHRTVSLDDIKLIKNTMNMTVNDVVLGVSQAGLSQYLERRYGDKGKTKEDEEIKRNSNDVSKIRTVLNYWRKFFKFFIKRFYVMTSLSQKIRLRSLLVVNLRPTIGIQDLDNMMTNKSKFRWGNCIGYIIFPISICSRDDPLEHLRTAKKIIDRKKNSFESVLTYIVSEFIINLFGVKAASNIVNRALSNTTITFSNLIGPIEEISLYGHPVTYMAPSVYGHPHALTMHFQSYMNKMTISLTVDPTVISDPQRLLDDWDESLRKVKDAAQKQKDKNLKIDG